jgi:hypothetical protein
MFMDIDKMKIEEIDGTVALFKYFFLNFEKKEVDRGVMIFNDKTGELEKIENIDVSLGDCLDFSKEVYNKPFAFICDDAAFIINLGATPTLLDYSKKKIEPIKEMLIKFEDTRGPFDTLEELFDNYHSTLDQETRSRLLKNWEKRGITYEKWFLTLDDLVKRGDKYYYTTV